MDCTCPDILLVEDSDSDAELALHALRRSAANHRVKRVRDGVEALDFLFGTGAFQKRDRVIIPRCILLDLKLPKVDGLQVLAALRADTRMQHVPCVVLSSSREVVDIRRCYELGANSYVVKPVDFGQFSRTIQRIETYWLSTNEWLSTSEMECS